MTLRKLMSRLLDLEGFVRRGPAFVTGEFPKVTECCFGQLTKALTF